MALGIEFIVTGIKGIPRLAQLKPHLVDILQAALLRGSFLWHSGDIPT